LSALAGIAACSTQGLAFVADERVEVLAPRDRDEVTLPLTVRWRAEDLPADASFAVAVDVAPPRPGHALGDDEQVVRTTDTEVTLDHLGATSRGGGRGLHRITVFLVDGAGDRLGESAWRVDVELEDAGS
jgi:hypothetical protein